MTDSQVKMGLGQQNDYSRSNSERLVKEPSSYGISPPRLLLVRSRIFIDRQREMFEGISPCNELSCRKRFCSRKSRPICGGILPRKLLFSRWIDLRNVRFPICGDKEPPNFSEERSSCVTLWRRGLHVTPFQRQKWRESFHELRELWGSSVIKCLIEINAFLSVSFVVVVVDPNVILLQRFKAKRMKMAEKWYVFSSLEHIVGCKRCRPSGRIFNEMLLK